jgi:beta-glucosidase
MNVSEKVDILQTHAPAIPRLAVRPYSFETECDSGVCGGSGGTIFYGACGGPCSTDNVTAFPQSIGMGQTWNTTLERAKGNVIGVELRSIAAANRPDFNAVYGLSCFSPMMNIIRDPMWCALPPHCLCAAGD